MSVKIKLITRDAAENVSLQSGSHYCRSGSSPLSVCPVARSELPGSGSRNDLGSQRQKQKPPDVHLAGSSGLDWELYNTDK